MIILIGLIVVKKVYDFLIPYYRKLSFKTKKYVCKYHFKCPKKLIKSYQKLKGERERAVDVKIIAAKLQKNFYGPIFARIF